MFIVYGFRRKLTNNCNIDSTNNIIKYGGFF